MKSMTGYGRAERIQNNTKCIAEISSLNRKHLELKISLPEKFLQLEIPIRQSISSRISRGAVYLKISLQNTNSDTTHPLPDLETLKKTHSFLEHARKKLKIKEKIKMSDIIFTLNSFSQNDHINNNELDKLILDTINSAVDKLDEMKITEGEALVNDIKERLSLLNKILKQIKTKSQSSPEQRKNILLARLQNLGLQLDINDERIIKEIAIFAEKSDISEELTRINIHIEQFLNILNSNDSDGKKLDFISQEIQREINTISAKATSANICTEIISFKSEIEKIREQIQNLE